MTVFDPKTGLTITIVPSQAGSPRVEADAAVGIPALGWTVFEREKAARALLWTASPEE